jgi:hypothetical protein
VERIKLAVYTAALLILTAGSILLEAEHIKNPRPTHVEKNIVKLELVKEIPLDFSEDHFFARPMAITLDDEGNMYVFDGILKKIFKFDRTFKFVKAFGQTGQGPGEMLGVDMGLQKLYFSKDGNLYVGDYGNRKIIVFNKEGEHLRDIRLASPRRSAFLPVVDVNGNYYILAHEDAAVEMYDPKGVKLHTFLSKRHYNRFLVYKPKPPKFPFPRLARDFWLLPNEVNTLYDVLPGERFIIYITHSSTVYIFKNSRLVRQFDIWPEHALDLYREEIDRSNERARKHRKHKKEENSFYFSMLEPFFVDKDNEEIFYLNGHSYGTGINMLYRFNTNGGLVNVLAAGKSVRFLAKRNHLFYGLSEGNVVIFKEGEK